MATKMEGFVATVRDGAGVGVVALIWQNLSDYLMEMTSIPGWGRALMQFGIPTIAGLAIGAGFPDSHAAHTIGVGLVVGGIVAGARTAVRETRAAMYIKRLSSDEQTAGANNAASDTASNTPPASFATTAERDQWLTAHPNATAAQRTAAQNARIGAPASGLPRGGIPAGFNVRDRAGCAV